MSQPVIIKTPIPSLAELAARLRINKSTEKFLNELVVSGSAVQNGATLNKISRKKASTERATAKSRPGKKRIA